MLEMNQQCRSAPALSFPSGFPVCIYCNTSKWLMITWLLLFKAYCEECGERLGGKKNKNYCRCVLVVLGISREKITTSGAASPLGSVGSRVSPGFYLSFISAGSPSAHRNHSCSCSPTSRRTRDVLPRPALLTAN